MVGTYGLALISDIADVVSGTRELCQTHRQQIAEFGVRTMVDIIVAFHCQQFAVLIRRHLNMHKRR